MMMIENKMSGKNNEIYKLYSLRVRELISSFPEMGKEIEKLHEEQKISRLKELHFWLKETENNSSMPPEEKQKFLTQTQKWIKELEK